ncbi:FG-nucleoporin nsp1 [Coemansia sp. S100]|nr:FG-nucleoporin nsp1 [Coemansia sp. S100]
MFGASGFSFGAGGAAQGAGGNSGGGFGSFGGGGNLFGAKSTAPGEEAKPAAATSNIFGSGAAASKPDAAKSSVAFNFGNPPAGSSAAPATPTPAPSIFGAGSSTSTGGLFGAKPTTGTSIFESTATSSAAPATSAAAAPAASTSGGFGGFGGSSGFGLSLGGSTTTAAAETPTSKPLFGAAGGAPAAGGFQFGVPSSSSATTSSAVPASSAAAATESKAAPFGLKSDAPAATNLTAGTGFGGFKLSTTPVVSGAGSSDGKMTGTSTPSLGLLGLGSLNPAASTSTAPASAAATATTGAGASAAVGKIENATTLTNAELRGKTMEEIAHMWTSELMVQARAFHSQASTVSHWDRTLVQQGKRITELYDATMAVEAEQAALDKSLEHMEGQQNALMGLLDTYEGRLQDIVRNTTTHPAGGKGAAMSADEERDAVYSSAERLNMQMEELARRLTTLVEDVNSISDSNAATNGAEGQRGSAPADPLDDIVKILNVHLTSLAWVDRETDKLQDRVKNAQRVFQEVNAAQASIAGAYGGGGAAPADDPYGADLLAADGHHDNSRFSFPGAFVSELAPPVTSSFGTPMATARKPMNSSLLGRGNGLANNPSGLRSSVPPASPFGSTPMRRGF